MGLIEWLNWYRICLQCRRPGFDSLGWEDLEKEMATHSSIHAWRIPWTDSDTTVQLSLSYVREIINKDLLYNTGNYTQYSVITYMGKDSKKNRYMYMHT